MARSRLYRSRCLQANSKYSCERSTRFTKFCTAQTSTFQEHIFQKHISLKKITFLSNLLAEEVVRFVLIFFTISRFEEFQNFFSTIVAIFALNVDDFCRNFATFLSKCNKFAQICQIVRTFCRNFRDCRNYLFSKMNNSFASLHVLQNHTTR